MAVRRGVEHLAANRSEARAVEAHQAGGSGCARGVLHCCGFDEAAQECINEEGVLIETERGARKLNPAFTVLTQSQNTIRAFAHEFGLTPASESNVAGKAEEDEEFNRSPELPDAETLERLKISPEVAWYCLERGMDLPKDGRCRRSRHRSQGTSMAQCSTPLASTSAIELPHTPSHAGQVGWQAA